MQSTKWAAVEPVPRPSFMPERTRAAARSAAFRFSNSMGEWSMAASANSSISAIAALAGKGNRRILATRSPNTDLGRTAREFRHANDRQHHFHYRRRIGHRPGARPGLSRPGQQGDHRRAAQGAAAGDGANPSRHGFLRNRPARPAQDRRSRRLAGDDPSGRQRPDQQCRDHGRATGRAASWTTT